MSIPIQSIILGRNSSWIFTWSNQGQTFSRVVLWGFSLAKVTGLTYTWSNPDYASFPPPLEIAYENQQVQSEIYSPILTVQWYGESSAQVYWVQQYNGTAWNTIATIQEVGNWMYTWRSSILADETTYQYRVIAVNQFGDQSTPRQYTRYMVTLPRLTETGIKIGYANPNVTVQAV